ATAGRATRRGRRAHCWTPGCWTPSNTTMWPATATSICRQETRHAGRPARGALALPEGARARGRTTLVNERALLAMTRALNERVGSAVSTGRLPIVYGGDCSTLLGIVTGLRDHVGEVGLVFIDGHEDTMPLDVSEDGEAANTELGLLLGLTGRTWGGELGDRLPALRRDRLVVLGPRDDAWRSRFNVGTLADNGVWGAPAADGADGPHGAGRR